MKVSSMEDLKKSLQSSWQLNRHCVLEVVTNIKSNVELHDKLKDEVLQNLKSQLENVQRHGTIVDAFVKECSIPLRNSLTTKDGKHHDKRLVIHVYLEVLFSDGRYSRTIGEIAPLPGLHYESFADAWEQSLLLCDTLKGRSFQSANGIVPLEEMFNSLSCSHSRKSFMYPSVRFGFEQALWHAISKPRGETIDQFSKVSALYNPFKKSWREIRTEVASIKNDGYKCIKVKVGRSENPLHEAEIIKVIREVVGKDISLRLDANQSWSTCDALRFASAVEHLNIEYVEEPLADPTDLTTWHLHSCVPVALDESLDQGIYSMDCDLPMCAKVVLKPSLMGGMHTTLSLSEAAKEMGVQVVISSSFEGPTGLLHLAAIAHYVDPLSSTWHGISTESWFQGSCCLSLPKPQDGRVMPSRVRAGFSKCFSGTNDLVTYTPTLQYQVDTPNIVWNIAEARDGFRQVYPQQECPIILLHGLFGSHEEMAVVAHELSIKAGRSVLMVDLPGHGASSWKDPDQLSANKSTDINCLEEISDSLADLVSPFGTACTLVGYSLGARVALLAATRHPDLFAKVISVSGSIGLEGKEERHRRRTIDASIAQKMEEMDIIDFLDEWYKAPLWTSLREQKFFDNYLIEKARLLRGHEMMAGMMLRECSPGKAPYVKQNLTQLKGRNGNPVSKVAFIAGEKDGKYAELTKKLSCEFPTTIVEDAGHAIHIEQPELLVSAIEAHLPAMGS